MGEGEERWLNVNGASLGMNFAALADFSSVMVLIIVLLVATMNNVWLMRPLIIAPNVAESW